MSRPETLLGAGAVTVLAAGIAAAAVGAGPAARHASAPSRPPAVTLPAANAAAQSSTTQSAATRAAAVARARAAAKAAAARQRAAASHSGQANGPGTAHVLPFTGPVSLDLTVTTTGVGVALVALGGLLTVSGVPVVAPTALDRLRRPPRSRARGRRRRR